MIINNTLGIVFANAHDALLKDMTKSSSMAAVPYGGRYRLIDFALSNLSNGGVNKVGVITKSNYYSLMTHIGNGKPWDLDRKKGGINILPPYVSPEAQVYKGRLEAVYGILMACRTVGSYCFQCSWEVNFFRCTAYPFIILLF